ncbi:MAG: TorF family putative porin [Kangiellaceae bacterium]|nr:TorF family putative porin [Kangiellaceae bacterium]
MKTFKYLAITATLLSSVAFSTNSSAELSANLGVVSQYHFRGIQQTTGASTSAGIDYEKDGFSLGAWTADVDDGLEIDFYGSYGIELDGGISLGFGATSYQYTGDFDSAYNEINLSADYGSFSLGYNIGQWDGVVGNESATESDYTILTVGFEHKGFAGEIGIYGDEADGEYFDLSYGTTIGGFDVGLGLIVSGSDLDDDESLYLSFGKTFDL